MTDTTDLPNERNGADAPDGAQQDTGTTGTPRGSDAAPRTRRRAAGGGLSAKVLPELQALAAELGITGTGRMRKSQLIEAITAAQGGETPSAAQGGETSSAAQGGETPSAAQGGETPSAAQDSAKAAPPRTRRRASSAAGAARSAAPETGSTRDDAEQRVGAATPDGSQQHTDPGRDDGSPRSTQGDRSGSGGEEASQHDDGSGASVDEGSGRNDDEGSGRNDDEGSGRNERVDRGRERFLEREARRQERAAAAASGEDAPAGRDSGGGDRNDGRDQSGRDQSGRERGSRGGNDRDPNNRNDRDTKRGTNERDDNDRNSNDRNSNDRNSNDRNSNDRDSQPRDSGRDVNRDGRQGQDDGPRRDEEDAGRRGRFRERGRGRNRNRSAERYGGSNDPDPVVDEDDVLVPIGGILDIQENYASVRTSGYLAGPNDVYVTLNQVRSYGLRRGDAVTGQVRQQREADRKDRYNALVRLDSVNGLEVAEARDRPEFGTLTPLYPQDRLRLETEPKELTTRVIDLVMPVGKGQRALIVSPPEAGRTRVLQAIANAISVNNPEVHLMVVLVDERPEEVTDMQRSVKGEVIASTFDRPPSDHITVAELSIERAKRLVELGHDVVVLLDSITRLGRAYNLGAPASGRILTGGVDSAALHPPKRFLGAARNIENGGSLTIFATALVETGSATDSVIFEEFTGTANAELRLDRGLADKRIFPAIDVEASGTRKEEALLAPDELKVVLQLRQVLHALDNGSSLELLLDRMGSTRTNIEFLMQIQKTTPQS